MANSCQSNHHKPVATPVSVRSDLTPIPKDCCGIGSSETQLIASVFAAVSLRDATPASAPLQLASAAAAEEGRHLVN